MISLKAKVRDVLAGVCGDVVYGYPGDFAGEERICWRESENRRHAQAGGREHLAEVNYTLEIFASGEERATELMETADEAMQAAGFRREAAAQQFEQELRLSHITVRYRALADAAGNIYQ